MELALFFPTPDFTTPMPECTLTWYLHQPQAWRAVYDYENPFLMETSKASIGRSIYLWDSHGHFWKTEHPVKIFLHDQWENVFLWLFAAAAPVSHLTDSLLLYIVHFFCVMHDLNFIPN